MLMDVAWNIVLQEQHVIAVHVHRHTYAMTRITVPGTRIMMGFNVTVLVVVMLMVSK